MENIYENIIGTGVLFPIELTQNDNGETGWYPVKGKEALIENNLEAVFLHQIGTKFRQENFGSRIWEALGEPNTQAQAFIINEFMKEAFASWESRIVHLKTELQRDGSKLLIVFTYRLNGSSSSKTGTITYDNNNDTLNI